MGKSKQKKEKLPITPNPTPSKPVKKLKKKKDKTPSRKSKSKPQNIQKLLKPYSKEEIIDLVIDSALLNPTLVAKIQDIADNDVPHREIFVYGLSWSATNESVAAEFSQFGEIESCHVVLDKTTGKAKGFAFIVFKSRISALKALKKPKKMVDNKLVSCQLASIGRPSGSMNQNGNMVANASARKIYVGNVTSDVNPEKLTNFFSSFGEIEGGPFGFDSSTGKPKGYALFLYKTLDGAKKALEVPKKVFEGRQLLCRKAIEGEKTSAEAAGITTTVQTVPPVYAASARSQNMGLLAPNPNASVNGGLLAQNPNASLNGGMMGSNALHTSRFYGDPNAGAGMINVNPYGGHGRLSAGGVPMGMGGYNGVLGNYGLGGLGTMSGGNYGLGGPGTMSGGNYALGGPGTMSGGNYGLGGPGTMSGGNYGLGGPGTMSGLGGGAGSSSSQPMMQGYLNAYPSTLNAPKTYAGNPAVRPFR